MSEELKWDCSIVIYIKEGVILAEDSFGNKVAQGNAAEVLQTAIDKAGPAGEIRLLKGTYEFDKTVHVYHNIKLSGEGRGTVIVPPVDDFAFKIMTTEKTEVFRPYHEKEGNPLYAMIFRDFTIDGERDGMKNSGKGLHLEFFWSSCFQNLWIQNTGIAIFGTNIHESDFSNIYLINNGDAEKEEASICIDTADNLHFRGLYLIYPNYIGLLLKSKQRKDRVTAPRLIFITHSMFHGWLSRGHHEGDITAPYDTIRIQDLNDQKEGYYKVDVVISDSRITVGGRGSASVHVINSPVTVTRCAATCGSGSYVVKAEKGARVNVTGNAIYGYVEDAPLKYALHVDDAEVIFKDNAVNGVNMQVCLAPGKNTIIADNRFKMKTDEPCILVGDDGTNGSRNIQVKGNIIQSEKEGDAIQVSSLSTKNIDVSGNQYWSD